MRLTEEIISKLILSTPLKHHQNVLQRLLNNGLDKVSLSTIIDAAVLFDADGSRNITNQYWLYCFCCCLREKYKNQFDQMMQPDLAPGENIEKFLQFSSQQFVCNMAEVYEQNWSAGEFSFVKNELFRLELNYKHKENNDPKHEGNNHNLRKAALTKYFLDHFERLRKAARIDCGIKNYANKIGGGVFTFEQYYAVVKHQWITSFDLIDPADSEEARKAIFEDGENWNKKMNCAVDTIEQVLWEQGVLRCIDKCTQNQIPISQAVITRINHASIATNPYNNWQQISGPGQRREKTEIVPSAPALDKENYYPGNSTNPFQNTVNELRKMKQPSPMKWPRVMR